MLQRIQLLVFDLDYLVFDCAPLKVQALRQSLIGFADSISQSVRLPDEVDVEEGFQNHGFRWPQFLEIGMNEEHLAELQQVYGIHEERLINAGVGRIYPGLVELFGACYSSNISLALGAEASRDYLLAISDRHELHGFFNIAMCTEEFGAGSATEMLDEIMLQAGVNPSETLVLGTRPSLFQSAHALDMLTIGCGWGLRQHEGLAEADLQALTLAQLYPAIDKADGLASQYSS